MRPSLVEQLLILALDAQGWEDYDCSAVCEMVRKNARRARFRLAQSDKGVTGDKWKKKKGKKGNQKRAKNSVEAKAVVQSDSDSSGSSSSSSSSSPLTLMQSRDSKNGMLRTHHRHLPLCCT